MVAELVMILHIYHKNIFFKNDGFTTVRLSSLDFRCSSSLNRLHSNRRDITAIFFVPFEMRQMCATGKGGNNTILRESQIDQKLNTDFNEFLSDHGTVCVLLQVSQ